MRVFVAVAIALGATSLLAGAVVVPATTPNTESSRPQHQAREARAQAQSLRSQLRRERALARRAVHRLRAEVVARPAVRHAIALGAAAYGQSEQRMRSVAFCESRLTPNASNGQYLGLYQFGETFWRNTPFREFERTDPYASAFAASWAFARGMSRAWPVCG